MTKPQATAYKADRAAKGVYTSVRNYLHAYHGSNASAFRTLLNNQPCVIVAGEPSEETQEQIDFLLSLGTPVEIPENLRHELFRRRNLASDMGPWIEKAHPKGKTIRYSEERGNS